MTLYFYSDIDSDFAVLGNWWTDAAHTVQASALPAATDDVVINSWCWSLGDDRTVANATVNVGLSDSDFYTLNVTGVCTFNGSSINFETFINGNCEFNNGSYNVGTITGNCTFNDSGYNSGTITGNCEFTNTLYSTANTGFPNPQQGSVSGTITFSGTNVLFVLVDDKVWETDTTGWVFTSGTPTWEFNDSSYNDGTITGDCVFNDNAGNAQRAGAITGDCVFNGGTSWNDGVVNGNCTFNGGSINQWASNVTGNCTFNDESIHQGFVTGDCVFNGSSYNNAGTITGNCTFNTDSYNNGGGITGDCVFNDSSYNDGTIDGNCVFNGSGYHYNGTITGTMYLRMRAAEFAATWLAGVWTGTATTTVIQFKEMDVIGSGLN
jgi:hypothetical protein